MISEYVLSNFLQYDNFYGCSYYSRVNGASMVNKNLVNIIYLDVAHLAAASRDRRVRSRSATRVETASASNASQDMFELTSLASESMTVATSATSTTTGSLPSIIRRSSAPEIDEALNPDALSRISEVTTTAPETITSSTYRYICLFEWMSFTKEGLLVACPSP